MSDITKEAVTVARYYAGEETITRRECRESLETLAELSRQQHEALLATTTALTAIEVRLLNGDAFELSHLGPVMYGARMQAVPVLSLWPDDHYRVYRTSEADAYMTHIEAERDTLQAQLTELRDDVSDWRAHLVAFTFAADPAESGWKESAQEIADEMAAHLDPPKETDDDEAT